MSAALQVRITAGIHNLHQIIVGRRSFKLETGAEMDAAPAEITDQCTVPQP